MTADNTSGPVFSTKDFLVRLDSKMDNFEKKFDDKMDDVVTRQTRIETILTEGKYGERITTLEAFKNRTEGATALAKWAVGSSGIALVLGCISLYLTLSGGPKA